MKLRLALVGLMLAAISVATPRPASAQPGLLVGLNSATLKLDDDEGTDIGRRMGLAAGVAFNLPLQDMFSVELDALYAQKGANLSEQGGPGTLDVKLGYVDIPVLGRINLPGSGPARVHLLFGPSFNFKVSEDFEEDGVESDDEEDQVESFETAFVIGGGFTVNVFRIDLRYGLGLSNISKGAGDGDEVKNQVFSVLVGFGM
jgi:hypothetical protein